MSTCCKNAPIVHDVLKAAVPWHQYIGSKNFPSKWLINDDLSFKNNIAKTSVEYDTNGFYKRFSCVNRKNESSSIEFQFDKQTKKAFAYCKKNEEKEWTFCEWMENKNTILKLEVSCETNPKYNLSIDVKMPCAPNWNTMNTEILVNGKILTGTIPVGGTEIPEVALNFADEIAALQSTATIAIPEDCIGDLIVWNWWIQERYRLLCGNAWGRWLALYGSYAATAFMDIAGIIGSVAASALNTYLIVNYDFD